MCSITLPRLDWLPNIVAIHFFVIGHGGDGFLKFQDAEEITSIELADAFEQMWQKQRFVSVL